MPGTLQPVCSDAADSAVRARASHACSADILPPGAAGCAVGHDQRPYAAGHEAQHEADGDDA